MAESHLALTLKHRAMVQEMVEQVVPDARVWVFGSRATGHCRPFSDLDLLLDRPEHLTWRQRASLIDAFEASELPFRVDVVEAWELPSAMRARIEHERQAL